MSRKKSPLGLCELKNGLTALNKGNRNKINCEGLDIVESVDIDACFSISEPNAARWDYYIGIKRKGEMYLEVHEVSEGEFQRILNKANWLRNKIDSLEWPSTIGRPLFVAPTKGIAPFALYGDLSRRLALHKITVIRKDDCIIEHLG